MGFLNGIFNNASSTPISDISKEVEEFLVPREEIEASFKLVRDLIIFTNLRLIIIDKQGVTGKKTEYQSVPYKNISRFSVETMGTLDIDSELKIWLNGSNEVSISKSFSKDSSIKDINKLLSLGTLNNSI
ncbi:PH domain-containing protein [Bacillus safensis]|uniref:PH domain-containing protein n=1 Tax=Bacillus safensis TaxID=561879 RepID=UPI002E1DFA8E|nr:PH domain-containing protein [Bacillus safensis]